MYMYSIPTYFPSTSPNSLSGNLLTEPVIADAIQSVKNNLNNTILDIPISIFNSSSVFYQGNNTCYYPDTKCIQNSDIYTCIGYGLHGLSFDDGPREYTNDILDELLIHNIKASFYVVGSNIAKYPNILKRIHDEGHEIGIHTWSHLPLTTMTNEQIVAELKYTEAIVYAITGKLPNSYRPPYGDVDNRVREIATNLGFTTVLWNKNSFDTLNTPTNTSIWNKQQQSFISLHHDTNQQSVNLIKHFLRHKPPKSQIITTVSQCNNRQWYKKNINLTPPGFNQTQYILDQMVATIGDGNIYIKDIKNTVTSKSHTPIINIMYVVCLVLFN